LSSVFYKIFRNRIAPNVRAVYDVLAARIGKRKDIKSILTPPLRLQGDQNVAEFLRGNDGA
jgi:hypothetical protein